MFFKAFLYLQFWLFNFLGKTMDKKAFHKMSVKLTVGVSFINILASCFFVQKFFSQLFFLYVHYVLEF